MRVAACALVLGVMLDVLPPKSGCGSTPPPRNGPVRPLPGDATESTVSPPSDAGPDADAATRSAP